MEKAAKAFGLALPINVKDIKDTTSKAAHKIAQNVEAAPIMSRIFNAAAKGEYSVEISESDYFKYSLFLSENNYGSYRSGTHTQSDGSSVDIYEVSW